MKRGLTLLLSTAILVSALFSSCGFREAATTTTDTTANTPNTQVVDNTPKHTNGLTGEPSTTNIDANRPYAVMINNISVAQPQCGVSQADIIYEVLVEGCTRMMAIFSDISDVPTIGSMRSIRPYFIEIGLSYDAIVVHAGGSEQAYSDISTKNVNNIDGVRGAYAGEVFYRDSNRMSAGYEHSLFTSGESLTKYVTNSSGYRTEHETAKHDYGLTFTDDATPKNGESAQNIKVNFGSMKSTTFTYDTTSGKYLSSQYGSEYIDGNTDERPSFNNVLVLYADTTTADSYGRLAIDLTGTGTGSFICGGKTTAISWSHGGTGESFKYTLSDGSALPLNRGTTYICIVPTSSTVTIE